MSLARIGHVECVMRSAFRTLDSVRRLRQSDSTHRNRVSQFSFPSRLLCVTPGRRDRRVGAFCAPPEPASIILLRAFALIRALRPADPFVHGALEIVRSR
jgi:hypothetical protein